MPEQPDVWYRRSRDEWYVTVRRHQRRLRVYGVDNREAAIAKAMELLASFTPESEGGGGPPERTVKPLVGEYLKTREADLSPGAYRLYRFALATHLTRAFGDRRPSTVTAAEVEAWAASYRTPAGKPWASSTRHGNLAIVGLFLRWCGNPVSLKLPPIESRGPDVVLTDEQFERVVSAHQESNGGDLIALLRVLRETGARPGEVVGLTVEGVDWPNACALLKKHKTAKKGHKRILYFDTAPLAILTAQRVRYGSGLLFRTMYGAGYTVEEVGRRLRILSERSGVKATAYGLGRHSFATRALVNGVPDAIVAELLGHRGTEMVTKHYGHVGGQSQILRRYNEQANRRAG